MNFNGILSSESISPRSFYERRGFGYRRWTTIPENENENVILLYETPFSFERPISDVEDHPMMIEITTDEDFPLANASGVRYSDHTIYLDPWNTKFIFFDEQDKRVALSLSDNSLETKMLPLYTKNGICLGRYEKLRMPSVKLQQSLCVSGLERDKQLNKMKGLLYGYYIGANLSSSKETAQQYRTLMELRDLVAAILSSENHSYTPPQGARLSELFARFQENDPNLSWLFRYIGSSQNLNPFLDDARKHGWSIPNILDAEAIKVSLTSDDGGKRVVELLDKKHQALELYDKQSHKLLNPDSGEVHVVEGVLNSISILPDKQENELLVRLVNNVQVDGKLSSIKDDVSDQITEFAKELYGSAWGNSMIRQQLNGIRRYVRGQEADVDWNNTLIASIASVLSRGDEWDKMLSFMRRKGMSDYRVAFALYGAFTGFANMTRDFTDLLLTLDSKYVAEVYTEFHGQLHGTPVSTKSFADEYMPAHSSVSKAMPKDHQLVAANHNSFQGLSGIVLPAFNRVKGEKGIKPKDKLEEGLQRCLQDVGENATVEQFLARLGKQYSDYGWKPKNKPFKSLKEYVDAVAPVIISASRSTDIPAFYAKWFFNRLAKGYCVWRNPFNQEPLYVSFKNTKAIVFWTKNPKPIIPYLSELDKRGIHYYFQVTLNDYVREGFEPNLPSVEERVETFRNLSNLIGKERVIWRFDPLIITPEITPRNLLSRIWKIGNMLKGSTDKLVFSFVDVLSYRKVQNNLVRDTNCFTKENVETAEMTAGQKLETVEGLVRLREIWKEQGWNLSLATCAEDIDLDQYGIEHNRCIDGELMKRIFADDEEFVYYLNTGHLPERDLFGQLSPRKQKSATALKDKGQRKMCGCMISKDIGMYNTCRHFCVYCYANTSKASVLNNAARHSADSESLID